MNTQLTPELADRVDAWLTEREADGWINGSTDYIRGELRREWRQSTRCIRRLFTSESDVGFCRALEAAAIGTLLALVREAWGDKFLNYVENHANLVSVTVLADPSVGNSPPMLDGVAQFGGPKAEALVAALEAGPRGTGR